MGEADFALKFTIRKNSILKVKHSFMQYYNPLYTYLTKQWHS